MNKSLPSLRNPFADWILSQLSHSWRVLESIRACVFDDTENTLTLRLSPLTPKLTDDVKTEAALRVREMAIKPEDPDAEYWPFQCAAAQISVDRAPVLLMKFYNRSDTDERHSIG